MIVPLCPMCGHKMYFAGNMRAINRSAFVKRYMCINCPHVEDMIVSENDEEEFIG